VINTGSVIETNLESVDRSATPFLDQQRYKLQRDDDIVRLSVRDLDGNSVTPREEKGDWLSCVARKTGLPRLLLSWLLLMCAVVMVWLCLSAAVTAPEHKVYTDPQVGGHYLVVLQDSCSMGIFVTIKIYAKNIKCIFNYQLLFETCFGLNKGINL